MRIEFKVYHGYLSSQMCCGGRPSGTDLAINATGRRGCRYLGKLAEVYAILSAIKSAVIPTTYTHLSTAGQPRQEPSRKAARAVTHKYDSLQSTAKNLDDPHGNPDMETDASLGLCKIVTSDRLGVILQPVLLFAQTRFEILVFRHN
jgi:hypothetical protein